MTQIEAQVGSHCSQMASTRWKKKKQLKELEIHRIDEKLTEIGEKLAKNWRQVAEIERNWCEIAKNQLLTIHQKMKIDLK